MHVAWRLLLAILLGGCAAARAFADELPDADGIAFFEKKIRPLLARRCYECHSSQAKSLKGGLRLDGRNAAMKGGDTGPAIVPGDPDASPLVAAVRYEDLEMPPDGKLPTDEIELLAEWVRRGAPFPADAAPSEKSSGGIDWEAARQFWSFQPLKESPPPVVRDSTWPRSRIDFFVLAKLEENGLNPAPDTDKRTFIRRASFDLIGFPPTPDDVAAFLADDSPDAHQRLIDRLLASPHYGERWGRYWLDLARYTDEVASWLQSTANAWHYRDWVVRALNEDRPYNEFVKLQIAADLMENVPPADLAALGYLGASPTYWKELMLAPGVIKAVVAEEWEERIDAVSRTFLGLTAACARCHDHKFDPITTEDYYALAGVFASTRMADRFLLPPDEAKVAEAAHREVAAWQAEITELEKKKDDPEAAKKIVELRQRIDEKNKTPYYDAPQVCGVDDAGIHVLANGPNATKIEYQPGEPLDLAIQIRGDPTNEGPTVPRRFLKVLAGDDPPPFRIGSGRRELAESIANEGGSLAARVIVNRVWRHHFGRGLVDTPSDFGAQGARPTHPELLDDLAARFVKNGWSLKWLHRELMLSATYRQTSNAGCGMPNAELKNSDLIDASPISHSALRIPHSIDPENRLLWRMNRRRLEFEPWRDAMLAAAGNLDPRIGGVAMELHDQANRRRTIYGKVNRDDLEVVLRLYDFPDPASHSPARDATTTPLQGLFVLNGPFVKQQATALAERLVRDQPDSVEARVARAYERLFSRPPDEDELQLASEFLGSAPADPKSWKLYLQSLLGSNEFMFVD
jgi:hypothetical protein